VSEINEQKANNKQTWYKSPWVIGWLLLVLTVLAVNAYMIMQSINDFPGLVADDFYERGQDYEENIHKKMQNNEQWKTRFILPKVVANQPATITFIINNKQDHLASVEHITLYAYRPSSSKLDFSQPMLLAHAKQGYQTTMTFSAKGKWDLVASAVIDGVEVNYAQALFVNAK